MIIHVLWHEREDANSREGVLCSLFTYSKQYGMSFSLSAYLSLSKMPDEKEQEKEQVTPRNSLNISISILQKSALDLLPRNIRHKNLSISTRIFHIIFLKADSSFNLKETLPNQILDVIKTMSPSRHGFSRLL